MKVIAALHPSFIQRGQWPQLEYLRRDLALAMKESWFPEVKREEVRYLTAPSPAEARPFLRLGDPRPFYLDIETPMDGSCILCVGVARQPREVCVLPWQEPFISMLRAVLRDPTPVKVAHNLIFDFPILSRELDIEIARPWRDTIVMHSVVQPDLEHGLDDLGLDYWDGLPWKGNKEDTLQTYCAKDVDVMARADEQILDEIRVLGLEEVAERAMKALWVVVKMRAHGIRVNHARMKEVHDELLVEEEKARDAVWEEVAKVKARMERVKSSLGQALALEATAQANWVPGKKREMGKLRTKAKRLRAKGELLLHPNLNSPTQLKELLYKDMKCPPQFEQGSLTTNEDAMVELARQGYEIASAILTFREYNTTRTTFTKYKTEILHADLLVHGTATGRFSCRNPNLQNIPKRRPYAWKVRSIFEPVKKGNVFSQRDYSQIEARIQAVLSGEAVMLEAFEKGEDIHRKIAGAVLGKEPGEVTDHERLLLKRATYLESYGGGYLKLGRALAKEGFSVPAARCKALLRGLKEARPRLTLWREALLNEAKASRMLRNPFGRLRWFLGPAFGDALNFPPQSTTADIIIDAMVELDTRLPEGAVLSLQIHDELIVEHPPELTDQVQSVMQEVMERPVRVMDGWHCPTDGKTGPNLAFKEY